MSNAATLAISAGVFRVEEDDIRLVKTVDGSTEVITAVGRSGQSRTLEEITFTANSSGAAANIRLESSKALVTTESSYRFGGNNDTLIIASTKLGVEGSSQVVASESRFRMDGGNDTLIFKGSVKEVSVTGGAGNDSITIKGNATEAKFALDGASRGGGGNDGNDSLTITGNAKEIELKAGNGNDTININGDSISSSYNLGKGSDTLIFGGSIKDTKINLGGDSSTDTVKFAAGTNLKGVQISGAGSGDVLIIGSTQYNYQSSNTWVSTTNPDDKLKL
jgi:hypothetical protein